MKNFKLLAVIVAAVMMLGLTNCKKELSDSTPVSKQYVESMDASFKVLPSIQISAKNFDPNPSLTLVDRNWYTYTCNTAFYAPLLVPNTSDLFTLVRGLEFITGSVAYNFWSVVNNNPIILPCGPGVFQNQIPVEPMRIAVESRNAGGDIAYIAMRDFQPATANFPLDLVEYRLGDNVTVDADQLLGMPGGTLTITATYGLSPVDLEKTRKGNMLGSELGFDDIKLGAPVLTTKSIVSGGTTLYNGFSQKVTGTINIKIVENWDGLDGHHTATINLPPIAAKGCGTGMHLVLSTSKLGWFDSAISGVTERDILVETVAVPVN